MKIILKEDIKKVGNMGDEVSVANGYARNFLLPKGKAILSNTGNASIIENLKRQRAAKLEKIKQEALSLAEKLKKVTCCIKKKVGEQEKLFGSVTTLDIVKNLNDQGIEISRRHICLDTPIKNLGDFTVPVRLHQEVTVDLTVTVVSANP